MRVLFFTPQQLWPANSGARLRNLHLAKALAQHCSVTLLQILQPEEDLHASDESAIFQRVLSAKKDRSYTPAKVLRGLLGPLPVTVLNYSSAETAHLLNETLHSEDFDAVQLESSHLFSYIDIVRSAPGRPKLLLDWHNIESELMVRFASETKNLAKKVIAQRTSHLLQRLESDLLQSCDAHTVVSDREKKALLHRNPGANVQVVPNGVDTSTFFSQETSFSGQTLLFVGSMDYHANIDAAKWFAQGIWPSVSQQFPVLRFTIVGRSPGKDVQALASDRIQVTGTVADVRPFYSDALAVVVPLRVGGGTRLKILEAMAMGTPVISTTLGAEGISYTNGKNILLADSAHEMSDAVKQIAENPALRLQLSTEGRVLVSQHYDWNSIGSRLFDIHSGLVTARVRR